MTHDRAFLDGVATRILELDRGTIRSYPGNFSAYERLKEEQLAADALAERARRQAARAGGGLDPQGRRGAPHAQRRAASSGCRSCARSARARRESLGQVRLEIDSGVPSGKIVAELRDVDDGVRRRRRRSSSDFSATILRGDKVGLIGPNGAGKTTLLKLILGELQPTAGTVRQGTRLEVAYFDQMRSTLNLDATLADTISPGSEWVEFNGANAST